MIIEIKCPCCQKHIQLILSSNGDADDNVSVLSIKEKDIEDTNKQNGVVKCTLIHIQKKLTNSCHCNNGKVERGYVTLPEINISKV